jgi:hypothetical protein
VKFVVFLRDRKRGAGQWAHATLHVRREVVSVDICNKLYDFAPRSYRAHRYGSGGASLITFVPTLILGWSWRAFTKTMQPLSREEELVVDRCAADATSDGQYGHALVRYAVLKLAMEMGNNDMPAKINSDLYRRMTREPTRKIGTANGGTSDGHMRRSRLADEFKTFAQKAEARSEKWKVSVVTGVNAVQFVDVTRRQNFNKPLPSWVSTDQRLWETPGTYGPRLAAWIAQ